MAPPKGNIPSSINNRRSSPPPASPENTASYQEDDASDRSGDDVDFSSLKVYRGVLSQLEASLRGAMPDWKRSKLAAYLQVSND